MTSALLALLRIDARKRSMDWYRDFGPVWQALGEDDLSNMGLWPADTPGDAQRALIDAVVEPFGPGEWLDVGCGRGGAVRYLSDRASLTGADVDADAVAHARAAGGGRFYWADGDRLPFHAETFDAVLAVEVSHHARDPDQLAHQLWTVLKPGGWMAVAGWMERPERNRLYDRALLRATRGAMGASSMGTHEGWTHRLSSLGLQNVRMTDVSERVFAGLPTWLDRLDASGRSAPAQLAYRQALQALMDRGPQGLLGYSIVHAQKPADDARWAGPDPS
jgi:SAM-dependent methyltransferase